MEKRLVPFLILSMLVTTGYLYLAQRFAPPRKPGPAGADAGRNQPPAAAGPDREADPPLREDEPLEADPAAEEGDARPAEPPPAEPPREWVTLGSVDPASPYRMLVTLTNRGAAVERIELSSSRYRDLEDLSGYLGHLALVDDPVSGCRVNVVGPGTPAALAQPDRTGTPVGLRPGDVITEVGGARTPTVRDFQRRMAATRPRQELPVAVRRTDLKTGQTTALTFSVRLIRRPLEVVRPEPVPSDAEHPLHPASLLWTLQQLGQRSVRFGESELPGLPSLLEGHWQTEVADTPDGPSVVFRRRLFPAQLEPLEIEGELEIVKRYRLARVPAAQQDNPLARAYHLSLEIEVHNRGRTALDVAYRLDGPTGLPAEGWWYAYKTQPRAWSGAGIRDIVWQSQGGRHEMFANPKIVKNAQQDPKNPNTPLFVAGENPRLHYAGSDAQYFAAVVMADPGTGDARAGDDVDYSLAQALAFPVGEINTVKTSRTDVSFRLISPPRRLAAGQSFRLPLTIFAGPKHPLLLDEYGLQPLIVYGWFGAVSRPMLAILHFFYAICRNYGISIVLLTVLVRGLMFPLGRKQALNAQKMQELAPEMKKIAEKYKNDLEKRSEAQRELFRKHNYNPLSGCLLMFLQLPIFVGLYRGLSVDIELRQAPLIPGISWCSNLAGPDQLFRWDGLLPGFLAGYNGWLGPYFNLLPIISVGLFLVHQKLFMPPAADEQQKLQQQVMSFMTLFIGVMFFRVPAGLCIYFIASSLWGLAERKLLPKASPGASAEPAASEAPAAVEGNGAGRKAAAARRKQRRR